MNQRQEARRQGQQAEKAARDDWKEEKHRDPERELEERTQNLEDLYQRTGEGEARR